MAEKIQCLICGFKTVRRGIANHIKHGHPEKWLGPNGVLGDDIVISLGFETTKERIMRREVKK